MRMFSGTLLVQLPLPVEPEDLSTFDGLTVPV
jgi:hypothetical protein